jgi:hypothetical protein
MVAQPSLCRVILRSRQSARGAPGNVAATRPLRDVRRPRIVLPNNVLDNRVAKSILFIILEVSFPKILPEEQIV